MNQRIARYLLRHLRREAEHDSISSAIEVGLLAEVTRSVDDHEVRLFVATTGSELMSRSQIDRALSRARGVSVGGPAPIDVEHEFTFDDDDGIVVTERARKRKTSSRTDTESDDRGATQTSERDASKRTASLLRLVRKSAAPFKAVDVATLLLVAQALSDDPSILAETRWALSLPQPIFLIDCRVRGFEAAFLDLLKRGVILPGTVALSDGTRPNLSGLTHSELARWYAVFFRVGEKKGNIDNAFIYRAARDLLPIVSVNEGDFDVPSLFTNAAQIVLDGGRLTSGIVRQTLRIVLGDAPEDDSHYGDPSRLGLSDLAMAIRPGVPAVRALEVLRRLAEKAASDAESEDSSGGGGATGYASSGFARSSSGRGKDQETGSEIIKPASLTDNGKDSFVPRIETLSGYGEARNWALSLKEDLSLWRAGDLAWEGMSTKLLLSGPPGTGKTTYAKALCNSLQVPLIATSVANWLEPGYLGDVIKRMKRAFEEARAHAPCILFIDEFDGIGKRGRRREYDDYWTSVINRLLELLDGATKSTGVIVIGATNNPDAIDPALLRSGRLEKQIVIPLPDADALADIIRHHLKGDLHGIIDTAPNHPQGRAVRPDDAAELDDQPIPPDCISGRSRADSTAASISNHQSRSGERYDR
jgi:hypothetical protein